MVLSLAIVTALGLTGLVLACPPCMAAFGVVTVETVTAPLLLLATGLVAWGLRPRANHVALLPARDEHAEPWWLGLLYGLGIWAFLIPLFTEWTTLAHHAGDRGVHFGLFPHADGHNYYLSAMGWFEGQRMDGPAGRRPLVVLALYLRLWLLHGDLMLSQVLKALITGTSVVLALRALRPWFSLVGLLVMYGFLWRIASVHMIGYLSATPGFTLGILGTVLTWTGWMNRARVPAILGILLLMVALNMRATSLVAVLLLVAAMAWVFGRPGRLSWRMVGLALLPVVAAMLLQHTAVSRMSARDSGHGNLGHFTFNLAKGRIGWIIRPGEVPPGTSLLDATWQAMRETPTDTLRGVVVRTRQFVLSAGKVWVTRFGAVGDRLWLNLLVTAIWAAAALRWWWVHRRGPAWWSVPLVGIGLLACAPVYSGVAIERAHQSLLPFVVLLLGLAASGPHFRRGPVRGQGGGALCTWSTGLVACLLIALVLPGRGRYPPPPGDGPMVYLDGNTPRVDIVNGGRLQVPRMPHEEVIRRDVAGRLGMTLDITPPVSLYLPALRQAEPSQLLVAPAGLHLAGPGWVRTTGGERRPGGAYPFIHMPARPGKEPPGDP